MRTRGRWHRNWLPVTRDVRGFARTVALWWKIHKSWASYDWANVCCHYSVSLIERRRSRSYKSILVILDKASLRHLFMSRRTSVSQHLWVLFSSLPLFYEEVSRLIPPSALLLSSPVRSFFCSIRCCEPLTSISSQWQSEIRRTTSKPGSILQH